MLSYMFLCCDYIATLLVPQFLLLPTITCIQTYHVLKSEITSRNAKITTLDPNNVFLAAYFYTKFDKSSYIYVYISLPKFAPFLSSLKKSHSLRIPSTRYLHRTPNPTLQHGLTGSVMICVPQILCGSSLLSYNSTPLETTLLTCQSLVEIQQTSNNMNKINVCIILWNNVINQKLQFQLSIC